MERHPFDDRLMRLSRRERTAFVGDLLAARGWDVEVEAPVVRATRGDQRTVVAVAREGFVPGHGLPREPVDAVVGVDPERTRRLATERDARAWDARTLYDMARHGLDPAAADRLFREHLGAASEAVGRPTGVGEAGTGTEEPGEGAPSDGESRPGGAGGRSEAATADASTIRAGRWVGPLVAVVVVVGGALAVQALTGVPPIDAASGGVETGTDGGAEDGVGDVASPTPVPTATPTPEPRTIVPGLTTSGVVDTAVFARGHAAALENRSFTMRVTYTERVGEETVGTAREVVRVENGTVYRARGVQSGDLASDLRPVIVRDLYADGEGRYLRQGDGALRVGGADDPGTGQVVERSRTLVAWYLSGIDSSFVGRSQRPGGVYYRVAVEGTSDRRVEDYRATGLVSERGLVVRVDASYRLPDRDRVVTVSLRHRSVGNTTVDRPGWMPPRNGSAT